VIISQHHMGSLSAQTHPSTSNHQQLQPVHLTIPQSLGLAAQHHSNLAARHSPLPNTQFVLLAKSKLDMRTPVHTRNRLWQSSGKPYTLSSKKIPLSMQQKQLFA
jgi:hypothetical protein